MKNNWKMTRVLGFCLIIAACGSGGHDQSHAEQQKSKRSEGDTNLVPGSGAVMKVQMKDNDLNAVYQHYVHLTTSLINEDAAEARIAANAIETGARDLPGGSSLATSASKISKTGNIEQQRTSYSELSSEMIELVKKSGLAAGEVYIDYCPMAMNDKGAYWLSGNKEIANPYFGDKMLSCGEIKEVLK
jgi:hypothetical protein